MAKPSYRVDGSLGAAAKSSVGRKRHCGAIYERVLRLILAAVSASIPAIVAMPARIAAIVEIAGALSPAAVAARSPLALWAEVPHEYEAGGEDKKDPGYEVQGNGHGGARREVRAVATPTPIVRCSLAFRSAGFVTIYVRARDTPRQGIRPWIPSSIPSIIR